MRRNAWFLGSILAGLASSLPVRAQPVKPNILIIFDTSGSMLSSSCDGQYPPVGDGVDGRDSRIYNLKEAMREALYYVGVDEANFGLARFPQMENACNLDSCNFGSFTAGYYRIVSSQWGGANDNPGCKLSQHNNQTTYGTWFDNSISEAIVVPVTDPSFGLNPPGPNAFDPSDANLLTIMDWLDQHSACSNGTITDPEIQGIPSQYTPLGRSLFYARLYFDNYVIPKDDPDVLPCRNNVVILVTDGAETCDSDMAPLNHTPTRLSDCNGGDEFNPIRQACLLYVPNPPSHPQSIRTYVLTRTGLGGPGSRNDRIAIAGGTGHAWEADFTDQDEVKQALIEIIAESVPSGEVCNGVDDNCNGQIDEGVKNNCANFPQWCAEEECNNQDDDCDGQTDEGLPPNACGGPCGAPVPQEVCNGIDDDCDGLVDTDDPDYSVPQGTCGSVPNLGECRPGHWECGPNPNNGGRIEEYCTGEVGPTAETCNGLDDDCNGLVDDVVYDPPECVVPNCQDQCCDGHWECQNGQDVCVPDAITQEERCNGLDEDCDGRIDEGARCEVGAVCFYGECVRPPPPDGCIGSYFMEGLCVTDPCKAAHCPPGWICDVEKGDPQKDYCYDPCTEITCDPGLACDVRCDDSGCRGECVTPDCYLDPSLCGDGEVCKEGRCVADACFGSNAQDCGDQACRDGACVPTCVGVSCPAGQVCVDGECVDQPCDSSRCPPGRVCVDGQCAQDPCGGVVCGVGRVCRDGRCVDDPCRLTVCPAGSVCDDRGQCVAEQPVEPDAGVVDGSPGADAGPGGDAAVVDAAVGGDAAPAPEDYSVSAAGGGGCACRSADSGPTGLPFFLLLALWLLRRRNQ